MIRTLKHLVSLCIMAALLTACQTYHPPSVSEMFPIGTPRQEIHANFGEPMHQCGIDEVTESSPHGIDNYLSIANEETGHQVKTCEVYWTSRTSTFGLYFDYVAYDAEDQVIHSYRRFVD